MPGPEAFQGGFQLTPEQLLALEEAGCPLNDPVPYEAPQTIEEFRKIDVNNFSWCFYRYGDDRVLREVGVANKFGGFQSPCFQRFLCLYPRFVEEVAGIENQETALTKKIGDNDGTPGYQGAIELFDIYHRNHMEPRLFWAYQTMSQLIDKQDSDYQEALQRYGERRAVWLLLSR